MGERNGNQDIAEKLHSRLSGGDGGARPILSSVGGDVCDWSICPSMNLAENSAFDGTGCDNMTILLVSLLESTEVAEEKDFATAADGAEVPCAKKARTDGTCA